MDTVILENPLISGALVLLGAVLLFWVSFVKPAKTSAPSIKGKHKESPVIYAVNSDFKWEDQKPIPYRPYKKGKYHMTMGIKTLDHNEWLLIEDTYKRITDEREKITQKETEHTVLTTPEAKESVYETYEVCLDYLMKKYPQYFALDEKDSMIHNKIRDEKLHRDPRKYPDTETLIRTLARNMEEDFLILMWNEETQEYFLRSGSFAFPSGFDPARKMNLSLKDIHIPVPLYKKTIEKSMDKFFKRMKVGDWVYRLNWGIQSHPHLYAPDLNHAGEEDVIESIDPETLDFNNVFLRVERQCLLRLPRTKSILFTIRTYATPLSDIREEENALDLCDAIDGLPEPLAHYKRSTAWGGAVKSYLRRETEGKIVP